MHRNQSRKSAAETMPSAGRGGLWGLTPALEETLMRYWLVPCGSITKNTSAGVRGEGSAVNAHG